jgi:phosphoribosylglycinamide formyltransferase-1
VAVLASGAGTNLQVLLDAADIDVAAVASDKHEAPALQRAAAAGVAHRAFPREDHADREARDSAMGDWLAEQGVELVVLAGYMRLLSGSFLARFPDHVVNVHPSLLPAFPGLTPIEDTVAAGATSTGVTVHLVDEGVDTGLVLLQERVDISDLRTRDEVHERLQPLEHRLLPEAVRRFADGRFPPRS